MYVVMTTVEVEPGSIDELSRPEISWSRITCWMYSGMATRASMYWKT